MSAPSQTHRFVGIVGHEGAKFTPETEAAARSVIRQLLADPMSAVVSGRCHLGGIDAWAEEIGDELGRGKSIFPPATHQWSTGYKPRNIEIAEHADEMHVINVATYPTTYRGLRFNYCYHCKTTDHIKSGGCWTAKYWERLTGRRAEWHVIQEGS